MTTLTAMLICDYRHRRKTEITTVPVSLLLDVEPYIHSDIIGTAGSYHMQNDSKAILSQYNQLKLTPSIH